MMLPQQKFLGKSGLALKNPETSCRMRIVKLPPRRFTMTSNWSQVICAISPELMTLKSTPYFQTHGLPDDMADFSGCL
jgi:hypothetical protein